MTKNPPLFYVADIAAALDAKIKPGLPSFFELSAQMPSVGRTDTAIAASQHMTVILKSYASGGENALHAHTNEDHVFVVFQGCATFHGPRGERKDVGPLNGVMLPHGTFYRFESSGTEPLVMLRVGALVVPGADVLARIGIDGLPLAGDSVHNRQVEPVLSPHWFGPAQQAAHGEGA